MNIKLLFILFILTSSKNSSRKGPSIKNPIIYNRKEKEFKIRKNKASVGVEYDRNSVKTDASITRSKTIAPGVSKETTYSGGVGYTHTKDSKGISINAGRSKTNRIGPQYTTRGTNHEIAVSKGKNGADVKYTNTKTNRKGYKVGDVDVFNSRERSHSIGVGGKNTKNEKSARISYERKNSNTKGVNVAGTEVSRTDFNKRNHELSGGVKKTKNGGKRYEGSYSQSRTRGRTYKVGQVSYTNEKERGIVTKGGVTKDKNGIRADGSAKIYNKQTHTGKIGAIEGSYSREQYNKYSGKAGIKKSKDKTTAFVGGKIERGQTHTAKIGGASVSAGTINSLSGGVQAYHGKKGSGVKVTARKETGAHGGFKVGNVKAHGSVKRSDIVNASVHAKKNSITAKANYEQRYDGKVKAKIGKNSYDARAYASKNTYGALNVKRTRNGGSVSGKLGREYKAGGDFKVNGKTVVKARAKAGAEGRAHLSVDKKKGVKAGVGGKAGAKANIDTPIGKVNMGIEAKGKFDVKVDNKGIHADIGLNIRGGIDIKDKRNGKTTKIGGGVGIREKTHFEKGKVTRHYQAQAQSRVNNNQFIKKVTGTTIDKKGTKAHAKVNKPAPKPLLNKAAIKAGLKAIAKVNKSAPKPVGNIKGGIKINGKVNKPVGKKVAPKPVGNKPAPKPAVHKAAPKPPPKPRKPAPKPAPKPVRKPAPKPAPKPVRKPAPKPAPKPKAAPKPASRPAVRKAAPKPVSRSKGGRKK